MSVRIWCNHPIAEQDRRRLSELGSDALFVEKLEDADVAFGQPKPEQCLQCASLRWVHLSSAGWDKFERPDVRAHFAKGVALTNSSGVYREPCAQHVLGLLLAEARQLGRSFAHQATDHAWPKLETRAACRLLAPGVTVALVGYGSIAGRVAELLAPFGVEVVGVRRAPNGREPVQMLPFSQLAGALARADHVVNILPGGAPTERAFGADQFAAIKPGAVFYNIGRGSTVDQPALVEALLRSQLRAAYLDVTDPEPLPPDHPLWRVPGCFITPHSAGGHANEDERLIAHFAANLRRYLIGEALLDRVF
ncbi:MAG TPA: D-2-hydroxyacid dehydrogenase [Polyangiaceae bacterium]|nr:D-2-hydroxyacid dehydrogenase [Polyangiaceae bacterium]